MRKKARLAVLHYALSRFGGGAKVAILHSIYLKRMGFDVELFYGGPIPADWRRRASSEVRMRPLPLGLPKSARNIQEIKETIDRLRSFDIVLVSHVICPFLAYYLSKNLRSKLVWYCGEPLRALWEDYISGTSYKSLKCTVKPTSNAFYGKTYSSIFLSETLYNLSIKTLRTLDTKTTMSYQKIIANSYFTKEAINRVYNLGQNVSVVYPGIDSEMYGQVNVNKPELCNYILAVGAMIPMKNYFSLLKAFSYLPSDYQSTLKLLIIGHGPLEPDIQSTIHKMGLKNVIIKKYVKEDELLRYYKGCKFVAHPALYEPFGLVPLEAAFFGKTSLVSNLGGTREFVVNGETGILVDPMDPKAIANTILYLIENDGLAHEMGLKARRMVLRKFTIEKSSQKVAKILNEMISNSQH